MDNAAINILPWFPKEWSSPHRMLQPWRVVSNMNFYLAMTYNFGHSYSWC